MSRKIDLIGEKFDRLTVLSENPERSKGGRIRWNCVCDCGTLTTVSRAHLRNGSTKSCGCLAREITSNRTKIDLTGEEFDRLTVLSENPKRSKGGRIRWNCVCVCGAYTTVTGYDLVSRQIKSCGCLNREKSTERGCKLFKKWQGSRKINLAGQKFERILVVSENPKRTNNRSVKWNCVCDCGRKKVISAATLRRGNTKSCGCLQVATMMTRKSVLTPEDIPMEMVRAKMSLNNNRKILKERKTA